MTNYRDMALILLQTEKPQELARLKSQGLLEDVLNETQQSGQEEEEALVRQMAADLPSNLPYLQRVQALNNARSVAQEMVAKDTTDFWRGIAE